MRPIQPRCASWIVPVSLAVLVAGCGKAPAGSRDGTSEGADAAFQPLRIAAASDLQRVLPRLIERFQSISGVTTTLTLDASGRLAEQIKAGAPYDLFLSANQKFVEDLANLKLVVADSIRSYAKGTLVLCVHPEAGDEIRSLDDLTRPEIKRIGIANPEYAPYGVAAKQALENAGLWEKVEPRIVRADSIRQTLVYVENGEVEAALVSRSLIGDTKLRVIDIDPRFYKPLIQAMGIVADSKQIENARAFEQFVLSEESQNILHEAGFAAPAVSSNAGTSSGESSPEPKAVESTPAKPGAGQ